MLDEPGCGPALIVELAALVLEEMAHYAPVNFFGGCAVGTQVTLDTNRIHYSDITLRATFHHTPAICRKALDLIAGGRFQAQAFITGHAHLYELNRVFEKLMKRSSEIKTAIVP